MPELQYIDPIKGAAGYELMRNHTTDKWDIRMFPVGEIGSSVIDSKRTWEAAFNARNRWQKKENKAVTIANKSSQGTI